MILLILIVLLEISNMQYGTYGEPSVPCFFIFGDSLVDSGNNNNLPTQAKVNYPPYGIDFPHGPTGRFTNGKTLVDILGELLGFENFIPSFPRSSHADIIRGVNYASGSAGIRDETGQQLGFRFSMNMQLKNHLRTISRLVEKFRNKLLASKHLQSCLYYLGAGSNDYINNYFVPDYYPTSGLYTLEQYAGVLVDQYAQQIKRLYTFGARKIAIAGLGPIGCTPFAISKFGANNTSLCIDNMNLAALMFNRKLKSLIAQLNDDLPDAKLTYINIIGIASGNYTAGFKETKVGCCEVRSDGQCKPFQTPCQNRDEHLFFDHFHPTEAARTPIAC